MSSNTSSKRIRTPLESVRRFCMECQGDCSTARYVRECRDTACPIHASRHGETLGGREHKPLAVIKAYCHTYCLPDGHKEVLTCQGDKAYAGPCPLYPYRMGKNPYRKPLSDERRLALVEAGKNSRFSPGVNGLSRASESTETGKAIGCLGSHENNTINSVKAHAAMERSL